MDPLTQGTLGAAAVLALLQGRPAYASFSRWNLGLMGAAGGMAADLDVLIRSASDPLLAIEYHRHFTHSLAFIPLGGALCALPWLAFSSGRAKWALVVCATMLAYATHGLLDACTTYGTLLFWPFSDQRVSLSFISIIDPLFTLPLLAATFVSLHRRSWRWVRGGLAWALLYLALGAVQQQRAGDVQRTLAEVRGHRIERGAVFPSFANNVTWRSLYKSDGRYYVDKVRVTWSGLSCASPGTHVPVVQAVPVDGAAEQRAQRLFRWFSDDWVAYDPNDATVLGDLRYSFSPQEATPIWGLRLSQGQVEWVNQRQRRAIRPRDLSDLILRDSTDALCF